MNVLKGICLLMLTSVAGCMSAEEQRRVDRSTCGQYGFAEGSDGFAECMMRTAHRRDDNNQARLDRYQSDQANRDLQKIVRERDKAKQ